MFIKTEPGYAVTLDNNNTIAMEYNTFRRVKENYTSLFEGDVLCNDRLFCFQATAMSVDCLGQHAVLSGFVQSLLMTHPHVEL